ncbi:MAG: CPBP family intramembrane metalloprotease [Leptospiraceae bacterium]|nr:CPBP family intramembrane metalloprotease [Leptospiraceae bacterium]
MDENRQSGKTPEKGESQVLRNLSFGVLLLAGALSIYQKSDVKPAEELQQNLRDTQADFSFHLMKSQAILPGAGSALSKEEAVKASVDAINQLCESPGIDSSRSEIQCAVLLEHLGAEYDRYVVRPGQFKEEFLQLYQRKEALPSDAALFSTAVGDLVRLKQYEITGNTEDYQELKAKVEESASITINVLILLTLASLAVLGMGFAFVVATVLKKPVQQYGVALMGVPPSHFRVFLECTILTFFGITALIPLAAGFVPSSLRMPFMVGAYVALLCGVLYYAYKQSSGETLHRVLGDWAYRPFHQLVIGILGWCAIVPVGIMAVIAVMESGQGLADPVDQAHPIVYMIQDHFLESFLLAVIVAPILEEVVFRGFLYGYLRTHFSVFAAAPITGFIFAILHPQGAVAIPHLFFLGTGLCLLREYNRSLLPAMVTHMITNLLVMVVSYQIFH